MSTRSALIVRGGWQGHEPVACTDLFVEDLRAAGFAVRVEDDLAVYADEEALRGLDLIVPCWTMGTIEKEQSEGLRRAVYGGVNLAGWHGGMCDAFRGDIEYQCMTGGQFLNHPGGIIDYRVDLVPGKRDDPILAGLDDFAMHSEQYNMLVHPRMEVLATTTFSGEHEGYLAGCVMPVVWRGHYGTGRVFYNALGHVRSDFDVPEAREITRRGLLWAAGE